MIGGKIGALLAFQISQDATAQINAQTAPFLLPGINGSSIDNVLMGSTTVQWNDSRMVSGTPLNTVTSQINARFAALGVS